MKAYISVDHSKRKTLYKELETIKTFLLKLNIVAFIFADNYRFEVTEVRRMPNQAAADIDQCDILIAEVSHKAIGIGIEVGYAIAKMKPIIYLRHKNADHSTTVSGISDFQIIYENIADLEMRL